MLYSVEHLTCAPRETCKIYVVKYTKNCYTKVAFLRESLYNVAIFFISEWSLGDFNFVFLNEIIFLYHS